MVLHDHQANPHVHLSVRAESRHGQRLNPRKADLQRWRETFAEKLRGWGIDAEATRQATRGQVRNYEPLWRIKAAEEGRSTSVARAFEVGSRPPERSRQEAVEAWTNIARGLGALPTILRIVHWRKASNSTSARRRSCASAAWRSTRRRRARRSPPGASLRGSWRRLRAARRGGPRAHRPGLGGASWARAYGMRTRTCSMAALTARPPHASASASTEVACARFAARSSSATRHSGRADLVVEDPPRRLLHRADLGVDRSCGVDGWPARRSSPTSGPGS